MGQKNGKKKIISWNAARAKAKTKRVNDATICRCNVGPTNDTANRASELQGYRWNFSMIGLVIAAAAYLFGVGTLMVFFYLNPFASIDEIIDDYLEN